MEEDATCAAEAQLVELQAKHKFIFEATCASWEEETEQRWEKHVTALKYIINS